MRKQRDAISLTALLILAVILVPLILNALRLFVDAGIFKNLWYDMVDMLPFGGAIAQLAIKIYAGVAPQVLDAQSYLSGIQPVSGWLDFIGEFCKLCVSGVCYKAISYFGDILMNNGESGRILVFIRKVVWHLICAFLACIAAGVVLRIAFDNIQAAAGHGFVQGIASILLILVSLAGGMGILWFTVGFSSVVLWLGYGIVKLFLVNACSVLISGVFMTFIILNLSEGTWELVIAGMAGWGVILVLLIGIDIMIGSVFKD